MSKKTLFEIAVLTDDKEGNTSILVLPCSILATSEESAKRKAVLHAQTADEAIDVDDLTILARPFG